MARRFVIAASLLTLASVALAQSGSAPRQAVDITAADIKEVQKLEPPKIDQEIKIVDMGKYNLGVSVVHRGPIKDDSLVKGIEHDNTAETYVIISGSGTLVTGGTMVDAARVPPNDEVVQVLNGPSVRGSVRPGDTGSYRRTVSPGDVIITPPGVFHGWALVSDHVDYMSIRPDPDRVLPAGYVNPAIKK